METVIESRCSDGHGEITFRSVSYGGSTLSTCPICTLQAQANDLQSKLTELSQKLEDGFVDAAIAFFEERKREAMEYLEERIDKELRDVRRAAKVIVESSEVEDVLEKMNSEKRDDDIPF